MADNLFHPNCRKKGGSLDKEALNFISRVYQDTSFDGLISLGTKDSDGNYKDIGPVPCTQITQFADEMTILSDHDYYISPNIFSNEIRSKDTLLAINAIVIDVDCHSKDCPSAELEQRIEALIWRLQNDCFDCGELPHPHYIVLTGRGIQLWWCVVPAHAKSFSGNFTDVEHYFASKIDNLISEFPDELLGFSVDPVASSNAAGLFRLPGTVNTHCQKDVEAIFFPGQRLNLKNFRDQFLPLSPRSSKRGNAHIHFKPYTQNSLKAVLLKRLDAVERLRSLRNAPVGGETRNNFCLIYYAMAKPIYGDAEAYRRTQAFNYGFKIPLTDKELGKCLCSARRKNYKYSTQAIIQKLDITADEANMIGLHIAKAKPSSKDKKESRNRQIIDLFNQGLRQKEIAERFGIACSTVSTILKNNPNKIDTLSNQIQELLQSGKTSVEVSQELHCSVRTVERHRINPSASSTSAHRKCDKNSKSTPNIYGLSFRGTGGSPTPDSECTSAAVADGDRPAQQSTAKEDKSLDHLGGNEKLANVEDAAPTWIEAAVLGALLAAEHEGDLYISRTGLRNRVNGFLQYCSVPGRRWTPLTAQQTSDVCDSLCRKGMVAADQSASEGICYFLKDNHIHEKEAAEFLTALNMAQLKNSLSPAVIYQAIQQYETEVGFTLSQEQKDAIILALTKPVVIITGGPGTGKTTTMAALCQVLKNIAPKARVKLCAPTGKAAVHLAGATGLPTSTIHSLIGSKPHKINCDFLIVDEASMVDIKLFHSLLKSIRSSTHIIFCGDPNQLLCVGGGDVLNSMLASGKIPVATLKQVHRQTEGSGIIRLAHQIKNGNSSQPLKITAFLGEDMMFVQSESEDAVKKSVLDTVASLLAAGTNADDIQVLAATNDWCNALNPQLRSILNPGASGGNTLSGYTTGDRVLFLKNDYARKLHNGEVGTVLTVSDGHLEISCDGSTVRYLKKDLGKLAQAYAMTIHKAQGSEYPVVIIPIHISMDPALTRNLIYTAVTRSKRKCILVGSEEALLSALEKTDTHKSLLSERLAGLLP